MNDFFRRMMVFFLTVIFAPIALGCMLCFIGLVLISYGLLLTPTVAQQIPAPSCGPIWHVPDCHHLIEAVRHGFARPIALGSRVSFCQFVIVGFVLLNAFGVICGLIRPSREIPLRHDAYYFGRDFYHPARDGYWSRVLAGNLVFLVSAVLIAVWAGS